MNVTPLLPLAYYGLASLLTIYCLSKAPFNRALALLPVLILSFLALVEAKRLSWPLGLDSTFASMVVFYLPYSVKLLLLDAENDEGEKPRSCRSFVECYRMWNNPRGLSRASQPLLDGKSRGDREQQSESKLVFTLRQLPKMAALWAVNTQVFERVLSHVFITFELQDISPAMELPWPTTILSMSGSQHYLRAVISVQWLWGAYFFLTFYHTLLSIFFVFIVGFDKPEEWPPLFGGVLEGSTIRGFWGRFWHRLTIPTYTYYACIISRKALGFREKSRADKTFIAMFIFFFSGVSHSLVGWAVGDHALDRDILFFVVNFAASALETAMSKMSNAGSSERLKGEKSGSSSISVLWGLLRTFLFFYMVVPLWMYPKMYAGLMALLAGHSKM